MIDFCTWLRGPLPFSSDYPSLSSSDSPDCLSCHFDWIVPVVTVSFVDLFCFCFRFFSDHVVLCVVRPWLQNTWDLRSLVFSLFFFHSFRPTFHRRLGPLFIHIPLSVHLCASVFRPIFFSLWFHSTNAGFCTPSSIYSCFSIFFLHFFHVSLPLLPFSSPLFLCLISDFKGYSLSSFSHLSTLYELVFFHPPETCILCSSIFLPFPSFLCVLFLVWLLPPGSFSYVDLSSQSLLSASA